MSLKLKRERIRRVSLLAVFSLLAIVLTIPAYKGDAIKSSPIRQAKMQTQQSEKRMAPPKKEPVEAKAVSPTPQITDSTLSCKTELPMRESLSKAQMAQIRQLAKYESLCGSQVVSRLSFFIATPTSDAEADEYARFTAKRLIEMARYDIKPLVFFEPSAAHGVIDLQSYVEGKYDSVLDKFFASLKGLGVSDVAMGTWVPVPEGNTPLWSTLDPMVYGRAVTKSITFQKKHFPASKSSILLNSTTYYGSPEWDDGSSVSLAPYLSAIQPGIVDSFGLQGLPWVAGGNPDRTNGSVHDYLRYDLAVDAANALGVKDIWMNTGTFGRKYVGTAKQVAIADSVRQATLKGVVKEAVQAKKQGFSVSVHLFAEDKSVTGEATDWSYWNGTQATTDVLKSFIHDMQSAGLGLWVYDTQK